MARTPFFRDAQMATLRRLSGRLPAAWTASRRRRRWLFLGLSAPGFFAVFTTPLHQNLGVLGLGFALFAAACWFRRQTEPLFLRAEAMGAPSPLPLSEGL